MSATTNTSQPTTDALRVLVRLPDGSTGEGVLDGAALDAIAARVAGMKAPLVGYEALQGALAKVGIRKGITTLQEWKRQRKLPHRKHSRGVVFYLDEVLAAIGGRS